MAIASHGGMLSSGVAFPDRTFIAARGERAGAHLIWVNDVRRVSVFLFHVSHYSPPGLRNTTAVAG